MKTSGGNRALFEISEPKSTTAVAVQKLIDAGAVIVGKNKLSEFAYAGGYHTDHIDYLLPFNPRGDGYNSPGDSSGGSGASVASYEWLDASLGSDTGGSIRGPASQNGVFGSRPSHGAVNMTGSLVLSNSMDTGGVLVRDPKVWTKINKVLYSGFAKEYTKFPRKIYVNAGDIQAARSPVQSIGEGSAELVHQITNFTARLASFVHGNITSLSLDDAWNSTDHRGDLEGTTFADLTLSIYGNLTYYEQWTSFGQGYLSEYQKSHRGNFPYMSNSILNGWQTANSSITPAIHKKSLAKKQQIADWASNNLLREDQETCSDSIFLYFVYPPSAHAYKPDVSHEYAYLFFLRRFCQNFQLICTLNSTSNHYISELVDGNTRLKAQVDQLNTTLSCNCTEFADDTACSDLTARSQEQESGTTLLTLLASLGDLPDYTVTLGEFALPDIDSQATKKPQALPYGVGIVARHGCDFMVQNLISGLHEAGVIQSVRAGSSVYGS